MRPHIGGRTSARQPNETSGLKPGLLVHLIRVLALLAAVAAFGPSARAATINVNGFGDTLGNNGVCTIREAIINANNNAATWSDCTGGLGADVINLPSGTITFSVPNTPSSFSAEELTMKGDLDIRSSMTINGHPSGTTINGAALDRIFDAQVNLGVLGPNGGPTRTHALLPGSVAIDKGKSAGLTTDQRLLKRPCDNPAIANAAGGDGADIGAFEVQDCLPPDECCCRRVKGRLIGTCCPNPTRPLGLRVR